MYKDLLMEYLKCCNVTTKEVGILSLKPLNREIKGKAFYYPYISINDYSFIDKYSIDEMSFTDEDITFYVTDLDRELDGFIRFDRVEALDDGLEEYKLG